MINFQLIQDVTNIFEEVTKLGDDPKLSEFVSAIVGYKKDIKEIAKIARRDFNYCRDTSYYYEYIARINKIESVEEKVCLVSHHLSKNIVKSGDDLLKIQFAIIFFVPALDFVLDQYN